jgi:hypothetical protein
MYASIMIRLSPILKYQFAIDIQVISTLDGAANDPAGSALESTKAITAIHLRLIRNPPWGLARSG